MTSSHPTDFGHLPAKNQCDGCKRGLPLDDDGYHVDPTSALGSVGCDADLYTDIDDSNRDRAGMTEEERANYGPDTCHFCKRDLTEEERLDGDGSCLTCFAK